MKLTVLPQINYACPFCGSMFSMKRHLMNHIKSSHGNDMKDYGFKGIKFLKPR